VFNGEAIWLEGIATDWFSEDVRATIRRMHQVMHAHLDCFVTDEPEPLVPTLVEGVYANRFPGPRETVWTVYNTNYFTVRGALLEVEHVAGAQYSEDWHGTEVGVEQRDGRARLSFGLGPRDIAVVVQTR
jgi:hypothetical protein